MPASDKRLLLTRLVPVIAVLLIIYFAVHLLQGDKGLFTHLSLKKSIDELEQVDQSQQQELEALEDKVMRLRPDSLDPDFAEEQARQEAGIIKENEEVIIFDFNE